MAEAKHIRRLLVCDMQVRVGGHYAGFDKCLMEHAQHLCSGRDTEIHFLFNEEARGLFQAEGIDFGHVRYASWRVSDLHDQKGRDRVVGELGRLVSEDGYDRVLLMDLDQFQTSLFKHRKHFKGKVTGILFRPHHRMQASGSGVVALARSTFKRRLKRALESLMLRAGVIRSIVILNDPEGAKILNKVHSTTKFRSVPDPVFPHEPVPVEGLQDGRLRFLVFGSMSARKNIDNIIRAYRGLVMGEPSELLIVGKGEAAHVAELKALAGELADGDAGMKRIVFLNRHVSDGEMEYVFLRSHVLLVVYRDFFGSSGLLGRAISHGMKVVGSNVGLISREVVEHEAGLICDPMDPERISEAMRDVLLESGSGPKAEEYRDHHTPGYFASCLLEEFIP